MADQAEIEARRALDDAVVEARARISRACFVPSSELDPEIMRAIRTLAVRAAAIGNKLAHARQTIRPSQRGMPRAK
jgi:hypothetical protein